MSVAGPARVLDAARLDAVAATGLLDSAPEPAFDELAALAARLLGAPFAFITLVDEQRSFWKSRIGIPPDGPVQNTVEESFCQYVIATGEPLIAGDVLANPLTAGNPSIRSMGVRAWAGFPLPGPGGVALGSFCVVDTVVRTWTDQDVETLRVLSQAAGREVALRAAVDDAGRVNGQLSLLTRVGQALTGTLDADEAVSRLSRLVVPVLGDWSLVSLVDARGQLRDVSWWHARPESRPVLDALAGERLVGLDGRGSTIAAQETAQPIIWPSGALETGLGVLRSPQAIEAYRQLNPDSYGVWPLTSGDTVYGVLVVARDLGHPTFTDEEIELARTIAQHAGTVLENADLYGRQLAARQTLAAANARLLEAGRHDRVVARALQDAMLTRLPEPDHLHIAARYRTADAHDQVGGDWYDALLPPDGATTVIVGDVAGHDIAAASVMGQLRNLLRALACEHDDEPPSRLISRLDRLMTDLDLSTMTTLVVARIEQTEDDRRAGLRTLRWSSAGHPAPVMLTADGVPRLLAGRVDPPLAVRPDVTRHDHVVQVSAGETLFLYTDGLIERRGHDLGLRQAQLVRALAEAGRLDLDGLLDSVLGRMVGTDADDDVAVLAVRFHPEDEPRPAEAGPSTD